MSSAATWSFGGLRGQEHPYGGPRSSVRLPAVPTAAVLAAPKQSSLGGSLGRLGGCSALCWRHPEIKPPREGCSQKKASRSAPTHEGRIIHQAESRQIAVPIAGSLLQRLSGDRFRADNKETPTKHCSSLGPCSGRSAAALCAAPASWHPAETRI